jgi:hypothetical protein
MNYPQRGYSRTLRELGCSDRYENSGPSSACLIDHVLANASSAAKAKSGYFYTYVAGPQNPQGVVESYSVHGDPATAQSGTNHFYTDETGIIRIERNRPADKSSPVRTSDWD